MPDVRPTDMIEVTITTAGGAANLHRQKRRKGGAWGDSDRATTFPPETEAAAYVAPGTRLVISDAGPIGDMPSIAVMIRVPGDNTFAATALRRDENGEETILAAVESGDDWHCLIPAGGTYIIHAIASP